MQKTVRNDGPQTAIRYKERLSPSLWFLVGAAVLAPMAALVFVPLDQTVALIAGIVVGVGVVAFLVAGAPVVEIADGMLRAGRARMPVGLLGEPVIATGDEAQHARGAGLDPRTWHVIRGGIDGLVTIPVIDPDDPTPSWTISSRTPDRLAAAVRRAQVAEATLRTPRR